MMMGRGSGPRYTNFAVGTLRKVAKNLDSSGRMKGRIIVPKRSTEGVSSS